MANASRISVSAAARDLEVERVGVVDDQPERLRQELLATRRTSSVMPQLGAAGPPQRSSARKSARPSLMRASTLRFQLAWRRASVCSRVRRVWRRRVGGRPRPGCLARRSCPSARRSSTGFRKSVKDWAIDRFGTADKAMLVLGSFVVAGRDRIDRRRSWPSRRTVPPPTPSRSCVGLIGALGGHRPTLRRRSASCSRRSSAPSCRSAVLWWLQPTRRAGAGRRRRATARHVEPHRSATRFVQARPQRRRRCRSWSAPASAGCSSAASTSTTSAPSWRSRRHRHGGADRRRARHHGARRDRDRLRDRRGHPVRRAQRRVLPHRHRARRAPGLEGFVEPARSTAWSTTSSS